MTYFILTTGNENVINYNDTSQTKSSIIYLPGLYTYPKISLEGVRNFIKGHPDLDGIDRFDWFFPHLLGIFPSTISDRPEAYAMEQYARDVLEMIRKEDLNSVALIGYSMGGSIALFLMELLQETLPEIDIRLVLWFEGNLDMSDTYYTKKLAQTTPKLLKEELQDFYTKILKNNEGSNQMQQYAKLWLNNTDLVSNFAIIERSKDLVRISQTGELICIVEKFENLPIYFVYGEQNKGKYQSERIVRDHGWHLTFIKNSGHDVEVDNPDDFFDFIYQYK